MLGWRLEIPRFRAEAPIATGASLGALIHVSTYDNDRSHLGDLLWCRFLDRIRVQLGSKKISPLIPNSGGLTTTVLQTVLLKGSPHPQEACRVHVL